MKMHAILDWIAAGGDIEKLEAEVERLRAAIAAHDEDYAPGDCAPVESFIDWRETKAELDK